jgi:hypothetical protein
MSTHTLQTLAITGGVGVSPESEALTRRIKTSVFLTTEGSTPLGATAQELSRHPFSTGARARFAGQEGETPLNNFIRFARY